MPATDAGSTLADFEAGRIDPARFPHREHVRISYQLLERHPFPEALLHLARGLRRLAAGAGHPQGYHETITGAFLAVIGERRLRGDYVDWETFAARNPDLFEKELLEQFYEPALLQSPWRGRLSSCRGGRSPPRSRLDRLRLAGQRPARAIRERRLGGEKCGVAWLCFCRGRDEKVKRAVRPTPS